MIKSMTGFGKAEVLSGNGRITVEIRSVNHRYGEIYVKLPRALFPLENEVKKEVAGRLKRGKIEVYIQWDGGLGTGVLPAVNLPLARAYMEAFRTLKSELGLAGEADLSLIASLRDIVATPESAPSESLLTELLAAVRQAVEGLDAMRSREGAALHDDLKARRENLGRLMDAVRNRAPSVVAEYGERLRERIRLLLSESTLDEARLSQEVAFMADRCDITEELVRMGSHLEQFDNALALTEPVGRKLDFLIQEMNREVNTIGSKASDAEITALVVELKTELEKVREQVQNIE